MSVNWGTTAPCQVPRAPTLQDLLPADATLALLGPVLSAMTMTSAFLVDTTVLHLGQNV